MSGKQKLVVLAICFLFFISGIVCFPLEKAHSDIPPVKWTEVPLPGQGDDGGWVLAAGSDLNYLTETSDGTLYVAADPSGIEERLFKSTDNGTTWSPTGQVISTITAFTTVEDNDNLVYFTTDTGIFGSINAGRTFYPVTPAPSEFQKGGINSLSVVTYSGKQIIAVSTHKPEPNQYDTIYLFDDTQFLPAWQSIDIGDKKVLAIVALPDFTTNHRFLAVTSNETDTAIFTINYHTSGSELETDHIIIPNLASISATVCFPRPYISNSSFFIGFNTGSGDGDVYRISWSHEEGEAAVDLNAGACIGLLNTDITALSMGVNTTSPGLIAGSGKRVLISRDSGSTWTECLKGPTGQIITGISPSLTRSSTFYAITIGTESAFSRSDDSGETWYQTALMDTELTDGSLVDFCVSPEFSRDKTAFLLTSNSLWKTHNDSESWERTFSTALLGDAIFTRVILSPQYNQTTQTIFLTGTKSDKPILWQSKNGGHNFIDLSVPFNVDAWAIVNDDTVFIAGYDGNHGVVSTSENGGYFYSTTIAIGKRSINSIQLSPQYLIDRTILVGNIGGQVFLSSDNGTTYEQLGQILPVSVTGIGMVNIAFDPMFNTTKRVFAASNCPSTTTNKDRIYGFIVGKSKKWEGLDGNLPVGSIINQIKISPEHNFYAINSRAVTEAISSATPSQGGIKRSLNSNFSSNFETVIHGLNNGTTLYGLWYSNNRLWSIDTTQIRLMTFFDTLASTVTLISPENSIQGIDPGNVILDWNSIDGASMYEWQIDFDDDFSNIPEGLEGYSESSSIRLPELELATSYYWRVRVTSPLSSPWSPVFTFKTRLGIPEVNFQLLSPEAGADNIPVNPVFQWSAIKNAEEYELLVSPQIDFTDNVIAKKGSDAIPGTAWKSDISLENGKTYYWKVRAIGAGSTSGWSATGIFTVVSLAPEPFSTGTKTPDSPTPVTSSLMTSMKPSNAGNNTEVSSSAGTPLGLIYFSVGIGLVLILLLVTILVVLIRRK